MWNIAQIAVLLALGGRLLGVPLAIAVAWGAVAGSLLQILVPRLKITFENQRYPLWLSPSELHGLTGRK